MCERPTGMDANQWADRLEKVAEKRGISVGELLPPIDVYKIAEERILRGGMKGTTNLRLESEK